MIYVGFEIMSYIRTKIKNMMLAVMDIISMC